MEVTNEWVVLPTQYEGLNVRRKFAGIQAMIDIDNNIEYINISYHQQFYTSTDYVVKTELKTYKLMNLTESTEDNFLYEATKTLDYFYQTVGQGTIIGPVNTTLSNETVLPVNVENDYPLHRDTRNKTEII